MKSTRWKRVTIILAVLAVVVIAAVIIIPKFLDLNRYNGLITSELEKAMGGEVTLGHLSWGITNGVWLEADRFAVQGATVFPGDMDLSRIYAKVSILPLLSKRVVVDRLVLESPVVAVRLAPSTVQEKKTASKPDSALRTAGDPTSTADKKGSASSPLPMEIRIQELNIEKGRISLEDSLTLAGQKVVRLFRDVEIEAKNLAPGKKIDFQLSLRDEIKPGFGSLKGQGTFTGLTEALTIEKPELKLKASLSALDTAMIKPYLKNSPLAQRVGGSISLTMNYQGDLGQHFSADGDMDLTQFTYTDPHIWEKAIPGAETKITYQLVIDPEQINIKELKVNLGNISLNAKALLQDWRKKPVVKNGVFSADVPLVEVIPFIPWKELGDKTGVIRQALAGGGNVVIEKAVLPELALTELPAKPEALLPGVDASIKVADISVAISPQLPELENITGNVRLRKGVLTASDILARMGPLTLPTMEVRATNLTGKPKVSAAAKGPMKLIPSKDADVEKLLKQYGLRSLSGNAEVDLRADYDQTKPQQWDASGSLILEGIKGVSHPAGVRLDDLKGQLTLKRQKTLEITVKGLMAQINQGVIGLEGKFSGGGTPRWVVDAKARTEGLNLTDLSSLFRPLEDLELAGKLDMNIDVHYLHGQPAKSRLNGTVSTRGLGLRLAAQDITVSGGNGELELAGNSAFIKDMTFLANDQKLSVSGQVTDFQQPTAQLQMKSPNLNLDRLLPPGKEDRTGSKAGPTDPAKQGGRPKANEPAQEKGGKAELPSVLRDLSAKLQADASRGQYRRQNFQDLKFTAQYERGVLKSHEFDIRIAGGRIQTRGSADLRNLERIPFAVQPAVTAVHLESIAPLLGIDKLSVHGPITLTGQFQGRTGSKSQLLGSLRGDLRAAAGPGRIYKLSPAGEALFQLLSFINLKGIFAGRIIGDAGSKGIPYDSLNTQTSFQEGNMSVNELLLVTPALELDAKGKVDLVQQQLNMMAQVKTLGTAESVLGLVPVLGKAAATLTEIYLNLEGPIEKPKISVRPGAKLKQAGKDTTQEGKKTADDMIRGIGKGLEKILGK
ncbi:MAG: AsmA-like C-terminal domain-containing protein [Syntrophobacterales bacterium]|jgi:uncharacterized protein involved in outer membrane biogenesis